MNSVKIRNHKIGECKGKARLWLQGEALERNGFAPGARYGRVVSTSGVITILLSEDGKYVVSKRSKNGSQIPIIDINNQKLADLVGASDSVRVIYNNNRITIRASDLDKRIEERERSFVEAVSAGEQLNFGSLYHGAGVLDSGLHEGFELSYARNTFWADKPILVNSAMEYTMLGHNPDLPLHGATMGIPCTGASPAGRAKNGLQFAEDHDKAGAQVFYALDFIKRSNLALLLIENVTAYASTASWSIIRGVLDMMGYVIQYREFSGAEFGAIENRARMVAVAISRGLHDLIDFDLNEVVARMTKPATLNDILDPIADADDERYKPYTYLKTKEQDDIKAGKGFRLQWLDRDAETIGTIGRGYNKCRSTEPFVKHPTNPELARLLTPAEHARAKTIPEALVEGLASETMAHEILGQSVVREWFVCIGEAVAAKIKAAIPCSTSDLAMAA